MDDHRGSNALWRYQKKYVKPVKKAAIAAERINA